MDRVPKIEPYAKGETIDSAIATAIIPKLLWPNKPFAGKKAFYRFTGYHLKGTSMGITPVCEAYANSGRNGGIATRFFYRLFLSFIYWKLMISSFNKNGLIFISILIVFFRAIYAESDLMRTLTAATKGLMFILIMVIVFR